MIVDIKNLTKAYHNGGVSHPILHDVNLSIEQGELLAITGASGSGKSTLLHIMGLLDNFDQGQYCLCGDDVSTLNDDQMAIARNQRLGFIFQQFHLLPRLTILQNVMLPMLYRGSDKASYAEGAKNLLDMLGLEGHEDKYPMQLSGGQQQRVAIARALITKPDLILADEPTGALDSKNSAEVMQLLQQFHQKMGKTIVIITHDPKVAAACERQLVCHDGRIN